MPTVPAPQLLPILLATGAEHRVPLGVTLLFAAVLCGLIVCLALEETLHAKKSFVAGAFAVVSLLLGGAFGLLPRPEALEAALRPLGIQGLPIYIPAIDWNVIAIIGGSSIFVDVSSRSGIFTWIAIRLTKASGGDPRRLLWLYGGMTVVFSAVLNNVTAMIIVGALSSVSLAKLGRRDKLLGFLLIEGLLTNIGGLLTLISSVPNIIIGTTAQISFLRFFLIASPFVLVATAATIALGIRMFDIQGLLDSERAAAQETVLGFDENDQIESQGFFWFSVVALVSFIGVVATASLIPVIRDLGLGYVALLFAVIVLARFKSSVDQFYKAIDWDLIGFFAALFIVIQVMEHAQVLALLGTGIAKLTGLGKTLGGGALLVSASVASSVTDNIPLSAVLANILHGLGTPADSSLWWSVVFGANLGGNLTPIGSASTLVAVTIIHKNELELSFAGFCRIAFPFAAMHLGLALVYVLFFL